MADSAVPPHPQGKHRYTSVVEGFALANDFARSRQSMSDFARQRGVSFSMVKYWSARARQLAASSAPDLVQVAELTTSGAIVPVVPRAAPPVPAPAMSAAAPATPPMIEVRLPNGVRTGVGAGFSPQALAEVIACVGGGSC
ncbi:MAG: hypothetical protein H0W41_05565 [Chloroflexi bacterium]|nr:hypothetical protein [Chloroflexota bacterium]